MELRVSQLQGRTQWQDRVGKPVIAGCFHRRSGLGHIEYLSRYSHPNAGLPVDASLRGARHPLTSVLLTNGDIDHIVGLLSLREQTPFNLFATSEILAVLAENRVSDAVSTEKVARSPVQIGHDFALLPGLEARVFAVPGKVPLFMEGEHVQTDLVGEQTVGVRLSDGDTTAYYIPGCADVTEELQNMLSDADQLFFDGTLWRDNEMILSGAGAKTGHRMGHISMSGPNGSVARLAGLKAQKTFVHINNTNPVWQPDSAWQPTEWRSQHECIQPDNQYHECAGETAARHRGRAVSRQTPVSRSAA